VGGGAGRGADNGGSESHHALVLPGCRGLYPLDRARFAGRSRSWFTEQCLSNALRLEIYIQDSERAGDSELADFFRRAQAESRKGAEKGKELLKQRLG
jgi:hypothetical protein